MKQIGIGLDVKLTALLDLIVAVQGTSASKVMRTALAHYARELGEDKTFQAELDAHVSQQREAFDRLLNPPKEKPELPPIEEWNLSGDEFVNSEIEGSSEGVGN